MLRSGSHGVLSLLAVWAFVAMPVHPAVAQNSTWLRQQQFQQQQALQRQQQEQARRQQQMQQQMQQRQQEQMRQQQAQQQRLMQQQQQQQRQNQSNANRARNDFNAARGVTVPVRSSTARSAPTTAITGSPTRNVSASEGRGFVSSKGMATLTRPLTPGEIKKGFTGKLTSDGRALVRFQGRVFAVPASGVSGLVKAPAASASARTPGGVTLAQKSQALAKRFVRAADPAPRVTSAELTASGSALAQKQPPGKVYSPTSSSIGFARVSDNGLGIARGNTRLFNPLTGAGPLGLKAKDFRSSTYTQQTLDASVILYRVHGGTAQEFGGYWTRLKPSSPLQAQLESGLETEWGNTAKELTSIRVPPGTVIYEGIAERQGRRPGGGNQVYLMSVDPSWKIEE